MLHRNAGIRDRYAKRIGPRNARHARRATVYISPSRLAFLRPKINASLQQLLLSRLVRPESLVLHWFPQAWHLAHPEGTHTYSLSFSLFSHVPSRLPIRTTIWLLAGCISIIVTAAINNDLLSDHTHFFQKDFCPLNCENWSTFWTWPFVNPQSPLISLMGPSDLFGF